MSEFEIVMHHSDFFSAENFSYHISSEPLLLDFCRYCLTYSSVDLNICD